LAAFNVRLVFSNYDSPGNPYYGGGGAAAIHEVARRLAASHQVEVVVGRYATDQPTRRDGVRYQPVGPVAGPKLGQLLFHFSLPLRVRRGGFHVWCESLTPPFSTACLQRFTARPVVALTQILAGEAMRRKYGLPFDRCERLGLRTYRHAIATSRYLRARLLVANPALNVAVIPNGVSGDLVRLEPERAERHILFLGRLDVEQKGLDLLAAALEPVAAQLPWPVVVAGAGTPRDEARLRRLLAAPGLGERVRLAGRVSGERRHQLLGEAALLVLPSRFEASPLVLFEAFCYRLPVVLFAIPELAEVPETCCVKVAPFDTRAFSAALLALAGDPARRAALGQAGKAYAAAYDWDVLAGRYADFFESVARPGLGSPPRAP
jgi:glycosyltransferase involved in cell wall biosynthesis